MPKKRKGARYLKSLGPYDKMLPHIMRNRSDSQVFMDLDVECDPIDRYIAEKAEEGLRLTYLHIFTAAVVRVYAAFPVLNRFVMNTRIYAYEKILISLAVRKKMRDGESSTTVKMAFDGDETIYDVARILDEQVHMVKTGDNTKADRVAEAVMRLPTFLIKAFVSLVFFLDRQNLLPQVIQEASPFHTGAFITYMKSLGVGSVYHHIYDFGTTGLFVGLGREQLKPVVDRRTKEIRAAKILDIKLVADERLCDGFEHAMAIRYMDRLIKNPHLFDRPPDEVKRDIE